MCVVSVCVTHHLTDGQSYMSNMGVLDNTVIPDTLMATFVRKDLFFVGLGGAELEVPEASASRYGARPRAQGGGGWGERESERDRQEEGERERVCARARACVTYQ